jgi:hypothetical protein
MVPPELTPVPSPSIINCIILLCSRPAGLSGDTADCQSALLSGKNHPDLAIRVVCDFYSSSGRKALLVFLNVTQRTSRM